MVCYPGGAREVFKDARLRHRLAWGRALGFARVAAEAGVPIVPFAGAGIDDTFRVVGRLAPLARLAGHEKYAVPVGVGLGPVPRRATFRFALGPPIPPPRPGAADVELVATRDRVRRAVESLLRALEPPCSPR